MYWLTTEQIIKLMSLPKIGRKTAKKIIKEINYKISDDNDLMDFLNEQEAKFRLPRYSKDDFDKAFIQAEDILNVSEKLGIRIISLEDNAYPSLLRQISDAPLLLNCLGNINVFSYPGVAIIGTREPSDFGARMGIRLSELFAENGFNIISGLAVGCDTAGHKGALNKKAATTAVLAHGLDKVYPKENKNLAADIFDNGGLLLSEYFIKQGPLANYFVERDRIQAGLSLGIIVIETDIKGGTMHTVKACLDNKRTLAALNHPIEHRGKPKSQGNQLLITEGHAIPIYSKDEVEALINKLKYDYNMSNNAPNIPLDKSAIKGNGGIKSSKNMTQGKLWE